MNPIRSLGNTGIGCRVFFMSLGLATALVELAGTRGLAAATAGGAVAIRADFPGGNVAVLSVEGDSVQVAPDLRGDSPWFYWCFEAKATKPGPSKKPVLVTGRHHACETIASYVLEGFLQEAMSDNPVGERFRKRYVLYAIPFVDKDGVEEGDQGKNRKPHDHNRDYGDQSLFPEVQAIKDLDRAVDFRFALDFHCPTLVMEDHQVIYFAGAKEHPKLNYENVSAFADRIKKGLPDHAPYGPLVWLKEETHSSPENSRYFGFKEGAVMAATIEIPFAPPGKATDPASCRKYGRVMLEAWADTEFREAGN